MKGDAAKAQTGMVVAHRDGDLYVLAARKTPEEAGRLPGWWVEGCLLGLGDFVMESDAWRLLTPEVVRSLWTEEPGDGD